jgi:hypothetical protein
LGMAEPAGAGTAPPEAMAGQVEMVVMAGLAPELCV